MKKKHKYITKKKKKKLNKYISIVEIRDALLKKRERKKFELLNEVSVYSKVF